jgi:hypothetical protein
LVATLGAAATAVIACLVLLPDHRVAGRGAIAFFATLAVGFLAIRASLHRFRDIFLEELQAGYATKTFTQGLFWIPPRASGRKTWGDDVVGWDWDGLWVLDGHGNVVSAPDRSVDRPLSVAAHPRTTRAVDWVSLDWRLPFTVRSPR